jgi:hypothetical protein
MLSSERVNGPSIGEQEACMSKPLSALTADDFEPHQGERFALNVADHEIELKLIKVTRLGAAMREGGAFSLVFLSEPGPFLPQAIYPLTHPALGRRGLFLVPIGPQQGGNAYEAIFA